MANFTFFFLFDSNYKLVETAYMYTRAHAIGLCEQILVGQRTTF